MQRIGLSLICPTKGRYHELNRLLNSLELQRDKKFELIIVDQNCNNLIDDLVERYKDKILISHLKIPARSVSSARNAALKKAKGEWLGFPDDDCWMPEDFVGQVLKRLECINADGIFVNWSDPTLSIPVSMFEFSDGWMTVQDGFHLVSSICIYLRRISVEVVSGFNECLGLGEKTIVKAGEDQDLILRMLHQNMRIYKDSSISIFHPIGKREWNTNFHIRIIGQGACDLYFHWKYLGFFNSIKLTINWFFRMTFNLIRLNRRNFLWYYYKLYGAMKYSWKI
jgi:glycosyltransferase involved in cell wall biosynthesis